MSVQIIVVAPIVSQACILRTRLLLVSIRRILSAKLSVTLIGNVTFVTDRKTLEGIWDESDRRFFGKGIDDPKFRLLKFHTLEATFWIGGKFRTCKYRD